MKLFVNTVTKECGMYNPSDLDDGNWIEAPKGTQAVYMSSLSNSELFYKVEDGVLLLWCLDEWLESNMTPSSLSSSSLITHLWGTLPDFEF